MHLVAIALCSPALPDQLVASLLGWFSGPIPLLVKPTFRRADAVHNVHNLHTSNLPQQMLYQGLKSNIAGSQKLAANASTAASPPIPGSTPLRAITAHLRFSIDNSSPTQGLLNRARR